MDEIIPLTRVCTQCHLELPITQFNRKSQVTDGFEYACKSCRGLYRRSWYEKNHASQRDKEMYRNYGITREDYDLLFEKQNGLCAICKEPETKIVKWSGRLLPLSVDHDHVTGKIRGLLCNRCNRVLGMIKDDAQIARSILEYL